MLKRQSLFIALVLVGIAVSACAGPQQNSNFAGGMMNNGMTSEAGEVSDLYVQPSLSQFSLPSK